MSKYIDTDQLKPIIVWVEDNGYGLKRMEVIPVSTIRAQPTADVRKNKRGRWFRHFNEDGNADGYSCSVCAEWYYFENTTPNFCPNCGADMRTKETDCDYERAVN